MHLTKPQKLVYDMEKFAGGAISVICGSMLISGNKEVSVMEATVNELYRRNDVLRIRISETNGEVFQTVSDYTEQEVNVLCFENKAELDCYAEKYAKTPLDLYGNLCEINIIILPEQCGLLIKLHHLIGDAWTLALLGTQFNKLMNCEAVEAYSYTDYVESEERYIKGKRYERDKAFFLDQFKRCDEVTYLSEKQSKTLSTCRKTFVVEAERTAEINTYAQKNSTSAFMLFTAALSAYINRTKMNAEKFYVGTAVLNRSGVKENNTAGMFVNTAPMLIELDNAHSFAENLSGIQATALSVFRHQKYNYGDVLAAIRENHGFAEKLYDVIISYQNAVIAGADIETTWYHCGMQNESLQIHIDDRDREGVFRIHYDYQTDKFTVQEIEALHNHLMTLLQDAIKNDSKKLYELELLTPDEKQKLLYDFNDTALDYPRDKCVQQLFEEQVARTPNKAAVIACDKTLTYAQLNEQANRIAHSLIEKGIYTGDIVAFALSRKSHLISAILGILKAGAAYLPVDPDYPQDRIDYILEDSNTKLFITESEIEGYLNNNQTENPAISMCSEDLCYCIYTSGSTGNPKGTLLKHKGIVNLVTDLSIYSNLSNCKRIGFMTTITFDVATQEILTTLLNGFTGVLMPERKETRADLIIEGVREHKIDVMYATPTYFDSLTNTAEKAEKLLSSIKVVCLAGEKFSLNQNVLALKDKYNVIFENQYGPVELHVIATATTVKNLDFDSIGKPVHNNKAYILDQHLQSVPIGVTGELCIAGDGVGAGYLNRPELTAEKFIDNPLGTGKLYKTGDLAYWREDGNIAYVGRNDFQVKIRGLRIELGEIENAIDSIDSISQAVVVVRKNNEGRQLICAFYTGLDVDAKEIRNHIGKKLPKYMLPHIFTHLDEMPLTNSGKVNRKALPEVDLENITNDAEYVAPENKQQKLLCALMEQVLDVSPVGIADAFFDLGGDSLKAIEFVSKAHNEGIYFSLQNVFDYPTVKELWECIENGDKQEISFANVDFTAANAMLEKNKPEYITEPQKVDVGDILLSGATGYLGIHLLADFLDHDTGTAYCLVRGKDQEDSTARLNKLLAFYFGGKYANANRIQVVCADLQKDSFGLTEAEYNKLIDSVDTVINAAASVKHYGSYKYFYEANVETTKRLVDFCKAAKAKLIHTSTLSVSGNSFADEFNGYISEDVKHFHESSFYIAQPLDNVYARSKFEAEKVVLDAMAEGLQANIMRMGNLTNRLSDGVFQKNYESNAFLQRVKGVLELGIFPDYLMNLYAEFTPIDEAANAVMTITRHFSTEQTVFHINSIKVVYFNKMFELLGSLDYKVDIVDGTVFTEALRKTAEQTGTTHIFETFINDMDENDHLNYDSNIVIENDFTVEYLRKLGFKWSDIGIAYLRKYVEYFKKIGYLE